MKKVLIFLSVLAVTMGFVACSNNDDLIEQTEVPQNGKMIITASLDATTRTSLGSDGLVKWSEGDKILIKSTVAGGQSEEFVLKTGANSTQATFEGKVLANGDYNAYYGIESDLMLSGAQTYVADNVKDAPMYAKVAVENGKTAPIQFKNLCGILELTIKKNVLEKVRSIVVSADEFLSGLLTVDNSADEMSSTLSSGNSKTIVLDCGENGVALTEAGVKFNIIMPANNYTGVAIQVFAPNGDVCTKRLKSTSVLPITRSEITPTSFSATKDESETHEFVDLGLSKKWATMNIGAEKEHDTGDYYAWGEIVPKISYTLQNYKWGATESTPTKYNSKDKITSLSPTDDVAVMNWGGKWHTPSLEDWDELISNCHIEYAPDFKGTGVKGFIVYKVKVGKESTDKGFVRGKNATNYKANSTTENEDDYSVFDRSWTERPLFRPAINHNVPADNYIFLPILGYYDQNGISTSSGQLQYAYYWAAELYGGNSTGAIFRGEGVQAVLTSTNSAGQTKYVMKRYYGIPVRAVRDAD